jgi:apolipoprotein N-acyltransferase
MKWIRDALTGKDNLTYDAARIVGVAGAAAYVVFWSAGVFGLGHFGSSDATAYGAGLAAVLLAMSGAVKLKETVEPEGHGANSSNGT